MKALILPLRVLHWIIVAWCVTGWIAPHGTWLTVYLVAVPLMVLHWQFNNDSCILTNLESWLATGEWRSADNPEEGGFIKTNLLRHLGWAPPDAILNKLIYLVLAVLWVVAFVKWRAGS